MHGRATLVATEVELRVYVDDDGDVVFLEKQPGRWSDTVAKHARRSAVAS